MTGHLLASGTFIAIVLITLAITVWAHRTSKSAAGFYTAGGRITPLQNGLAIAGDYLSAAGFLGTIAVFAFSGEDGLLYAVGGASGWPLVLFLMARRLRNLGRYTFSDVVGFRLAERPIRLLTATSTLLITGTYLIAQMVGGATLIEALFDVPYRYAILCFGVLAICYVAFGGMKATTWIQIVKASMLLFVAMIMMFLSLRVFGFDLGALFGKASAIERQTRFAARPPLLSDPFSALSLALAFSLGPAGLPHVLMRFFTVKDGESARHSLGIAATIIALFQALVIFLGYAVIADITSNTLFAGPKGLIGGSNMAALHLATFLGGSFLSGAVAGVSFATILAVVAGLTLAAASAVSHDLYRHVFARARANEKHEVIISKVAAVCVGGIAIALGLLFEHENIGFLGTLPLVIAASVNCPILLFAVYWKGLTTRGAVAGGSIGILLSVVPIILSPKVWIGTLGHAHALFPFEYPTVLALSGAVVTTVVISLFDRSKRGGIDRAGFAAQWAQSENGPSR